MIFERSGAQNPNLIVKMGLRIHGIGNSNLLNPVFTENPSSLFSPLTHNGVTKELSAAQVNKTAISS